MNTHTILDVSQQLVSAATNVAHALCHAGRGEADWALLHCEQARRAIAWAVTMIENARHASAEQAPLPGNRGSD